MSKKKYETAAERQRAHRQRVKDRLAGLAPLALPPPKQPRKKTRPQRLATITSDLQTLIYEYEGWRDAMPGNLGDSGLAEGIRDAIKDLGQALNLLENVDLPLGFGRR